MAFSFEDMVEEEETGEARGAARFSEDRNGPTTARAPPTLQLSRDKSCGGAISTPELSGAKAVWESESKAQAT